MHPKLIDFRGFSLPSYGVLLAIAYLAAIGWAMRKARLRRDDPSRPFVPPDFVADLGITVLFASMVGSKLTLFLLSPKEYLSRLGLIQLLRSGGVFYGGLIAATAFGLWTLRRRKQPLWEVCDLMAPSIALGEGIGRLGCLLAGCCWGRETTVPWAITFENPDAQEMIGTPLGIPLHPTQIYLSLIGFALFGVLELMDRRRRFPGQVFWSFILLHAVARTFAEVYRGDSVRKFLVPNRISTSQALAFGTAALAIAMLVVLSRRAREKREAGAAS